MKINRKLSNCYVCCLPRQLQTTIKREVVEALKSENVSRETLKKLTAEAMTSKVQDLENTVNIQYME